MKIKIEIDDSLEEEEVIIRAQALSNRVQQLQQVISALDHQSSQLDFYKNETQYYVSLEDILFFETDAGLIYAHTAQDIFQTNHKLYELEEILPGFFMRISKSSILNTKHVYAIHRNLTASSIVEFRQTPKKVYVSRNYYKPLIQKLEEKRLHHE